MTIPNTFSLSLQKQFGTEHIIDDYELNQAFIALKFSSMIRSSNIIKKRGRETLTLLFAFILMPFLKRSLTGFWNCRYLQNYVQAHKDTFYRFLNNETFNWRKLVYLLALKVIATNDGPMGLPVSDAVMINTGSVHESFIFARAVSSRIP